MISRVRITRIIILFLAATNLILSKVPADTVDQKLQYLSAPEKVKYLADFSWSLREKNTDLALHYGKMAVKLADSSNVTSYKSQANNFLGVIYIHYKYDTRSAIPYFHRGLEVAMQINDSVEIGYSFNNLGDAFYLTGNAPLALDYAEKSLQIFKRLNDPRGIAYSYINLGLLYRFEKDYLLALDYFLKAIELRKTIGFSTGIASALLEVGRTYYEQKKYEEALVYLKESLELHRKLDNKRYTAFCLNGIGDVYYQQAKYEAAQKMYDESLELNKERNHDYGIVDNRLGKALVYSKTNNRARGEAELKAALKTANKMGLAPKILQAYETSAKFYMNLNDYKSATESFNSFLFIYDSLFSRQQFETLSEIENRFRVTQKLQETSYELEASRKEELYLIIIIILMAILIFVFLWRYVVKRNLSKKLKSINDSKDKLFSIISHDLKNPFTALLGYIELLRDETISEKERNEYMHDLETTTKNTYNLLENLLNLSASRTGKIEFSPQVIDIKTLIENIVSGMVITLKKKSIHVDVDIREEMIYGDSQMIEISLRNVITNAIKFSNNNGVIKVLSERKGDLTEIIISDNGIGMEKELIEKLFSNDFVQSNRGTAGEKGTGLGLSLSYEFIKKHGGSIKVKSETGKGSEFTIMLPRNR